jgi:glycosyltransferase involved in cell wall biosynthesis
MKTPAVSVIMSCYREKEFVRAAVDSVLAQDLTNFEFIIVDDKGEDGTLACVQSYGDSRIRLIENETNKGLAACRNIGLDNAKSEYIALMDADDLVKPNWLSSQLAEMEKDPGLAALSCDMTCFGLRPGGATCYTNSEAVATAMRLDNAMHHPGTLLRKSLLQAAGIRYREHIRFAQDYQLWVDMLKAGLTLRGSGNCLYHYRVRNGSISTTKLAQRETFVADLRLELLANAGFKTTPEYMPWLRRSRPLTKDLPAEDYVILRKLTTDLLRLNVPSKKIWKHEIAKFLVSLMPRSKSLAGKLHNFTTIAKINPVLAAYFIKGYALGIKD